MNKTIDQQRAAKWAHDLLKTEDWCILDTETTGLDRTDQICQLAVMDSEGNTLIDTLVQPLCAINPEAAAVHGITDEQVNGSPTMDKVLIPLLQAVGTRNIVIYNAEFDLKLIRQSLRPFGVQLAFPTSDRRGCRIFLNGGSIHCAMQYFSMFVGEWNDYHGNYKWQKLPGGDHTALGDCLATLNVIKRMASTYNPIDPVPDTWEE